MSARPSAIVFTLLLSCCRLASAADQASGSVTVQRLGAISASHAAAYLVRDQRNARITQTEILLSDVATDPGQMQAALDPHMVAINLDALKDRNYILLFVDPDGRVAMNATFSRTMTQFLNATAESLKAEFTTRTPTRLEGRIFTVAPVKTMDGTTYTVDLRFGVDLPAPPVGTALPTGGGDPGKALVALMTAASKNNWPGIRAASSPQALKSFETSYNSEAENAADAADMLKAWLPTQKMKVTGGQLRGNVAVLDVEGEMFPGTMALSLVQMVKNGGVWQFDRAARAGMLR